MWSWVHRKPSGRKAGNAGSLSGYVADLRHVDDTISLTRTYCRDCIVTRATIIYPPGIVFEPQPQTETTSTWLDINVHLSRKHGLELNPSRRELSWVIRGESDTCQKHDVSPFIALRDLDLDTTLLRSLIARRITRWLQLHMVYNFGKSSGTNHACGAERATQRAFSENGGPTNAPAHNSAGSCKSCSARLLPVGGLPAPVPEPEWFSSREA